MVATSIRRTLLASTIFAGSIMAVPVYAQVTPAVPTPAVTAADAADANNTIVVTGSLIGNPNLVSSSPVAVIGSEEILLRQTNTAEQILRDIPGVVPNIGQNVNNGNNGTSLVDLRGLGSNRNIVLLDSTRIVPANFGGSVDLNNIPLALVDRVDVLTGGASTTYGADAISGVVNFITKRDFSGVALQSSEQISQLGDGNVFRTDVTIGANFDDGRGNAVLSIGYQEADPIYQGDRDVALFGISSTTGRASGSSFTSVPTTFSFDTADLQIDPTGATLVPQYQGFNFNPYNLFVTPFRRFNMYAAAHYDISDTVEAYSRGLFSKNTVSTFVAPSGIFGNALTIPGNNPYLNSTIRDQICAANGMPTGATCAANPAIPLPGVYRRSVELGPRTSEYVTNIFDYKAGVKLHLTNSLLLDVYGAYGESENVSTQSGYVANSRVQQALNATNVTTCLDTANGCVPLNIFGPAGSITAAQGAFVGGLTSSVTNKSSLAQAHALLSGDFGLTSPGSDIPVSFALGGEYRKYKARRIPDSLAQIPGELGGAGGATLPLKGGYNVYEAFGEVIAPLISDKPFFHELSVEAGVRYSKYSVDTVGSPSFKATTYKGGINWEPVEALKLRANYQRAVRAPNIGELFAPVVTGLTNLLVDPCAGTAPVGNANLTAICRAQGAPAGSIGSIQNPSAGQANSTGGGNPFIRPEIAKTLTIGAVFQPKNLISGLTITVDYYDIKVSNAITAATPADIISNCFGTVTAASATSAACTTIRRNAANGRLSGTSTSTNPILGLPSPLTNNGRLETDGIDVSVNYKRDLGFAGLNLSFNGNWTDHSRFQAAPTSYSRDCVGYFSANCASIQPKYSWNQRTTLSFGQADVSLLWRHISSVKYEGQASDFAARGYSATSRNLFSGTITGPSPLAGGVYDFNRIKAYDYFDFSTRFHVSKEFDLTLSAFNIMNRKPPLVGSAAGSTLYNSGNTYPSTYDVVGRRFAATANLRF
jgi:iron complex outermembrane receptor protein